MGAIRDEKVMLELLEEIGAKSDKINKVQIDLAGELRKYNFDILSNEQMVTFFEETVPLTISGGRTIPHKVTNGICGLTEKGDIYRNTLRNKIHSVVLREREVLSSEQLAKSAKHANVIAWLAITISMVALFVSVLGFFFVPK